MKNIYVLLFVLVAFSCTHTEEELFSDVESDTQTSKSELGNEGSRAASEEIIYNFSNYPATTCFSSELGNDDIEIYFSEAFKYNAVLDINVKLKNDLVLTPWAFLYVPAGSRNVVLPASCELPAMVKCGKITELKGADFKISLKGGEYLGVDEELVLKASPGREVHTIKIKANCTTFPNPKDDLSGPKGLR